MTEVLDQRTKYDHLKYLIEKLVDQLQPEGELSDDAESYLHLIDISLREALPDAFPK